MNTLDLIHELTRGRPFVLVIMAYKDSKTQQDKKQKVFEMIHEVVEQEFNLACLRADQVLSSGHELLSKIHILIDRATLVVAEISDPRPNVFYELGYAMGTKKIPLLLLESKRKAPYDLQGLEVFEYENTLNGVDDFRMKLTEHLRVRLKSSMPAFRDMLGAPRPVPSYIVANPKYPGKHSRIQGQVFDSRTFGDHLGILGLISAQGSIYGDANGIELISARHAPPDLLTRDINLYLIGSHKVNPWSKEMLKCLRKEARPEWLFAPALDWPEDETGDWPVALFRDVRSKETQLPGCLDKLEPTGEEVWTEDYGVLVRGPHPRYPGRLVLVIAGPHSLGTAAASLAATRPSLIKKLQEKLPPGTLEDKKGAFWALVKGTSMPDDYLLNEEDVTVVETGVYA